MIKTFRHKGMSELWSTRRTAGIDKRLHLRILTRLTVLDETVDLAELAAMPGYDFHALKGFKPPRYTIHVNGPWCITFEFDEGDAHRVDLEQYH